MNYKTIRIERDPPVLTVILNRPEKRNALNTDMIYELKSILNQSIDDERVFALVLTGAGNAFCAGADLSYLQSLLNKNYQQNLNDSINLKELYYTLYTYPKVTVALVNGHALAGGCGLVNVCDYVFSVDSAQFGYPEVKIGFVASMVSVFLLRTVGERQTKKILTSAQLFDAAEAQKIGLVDYVYPKPEIKQKVSEFVETLFPNSPQAIKLTKELLTRIVDKDLKSDLEDACKFNAFSRQNPHFKEGLLSFLEKRKPNWVNSFK